MTQREERATEVHHMRIKKWGQQNEKEMGSRWVERGTPKGIKETPQKKLREEKT